MGGPHEVFCFQTRCLAGSGPQVCVLPPPAPHFPHQTYIHAHTPTTRRTTSYLDVPACFNPRPTHSPTPQVIVAVTQRGVRPPMPEDCPPCLAALMQRCWDADPQARCAFSRAAHKSVGLRLVLGRASGAVMLWWCCACSLQVAGHLQAWLDNLC